MKTKRLKSLIGLELGNRRLTAVELHRNGAKLEVRRTVRAPLSLDPLTAAPELAGREIRNLLDGAGLRGSRCVLCLPLGRMLIHQVELPELKEEDAASFLELAAERAFPFGQEDLAVAVSRHADAGGTRRATLAAVSSNHLATLARVLRLAGLRPVSVTLGTATLLDSRNGSVDGALVFDEGGIEMQIGANGGVAALRMLGEMPGAADRDEPPDFESIVREIRITLGRLPAPTRSGLRRMRVFGGQALSRPLIEALQPEFSVQGIELEPTGVNQQAVVERGAGGQIPAAVTLAASLVLRGEKPAFEFLTPQVSPARRVLNRLMARGVLWRLGAVAGVAVVAIALAFAWQQWKLNALQTRWASIETDVGRLQALQKGIRDHRPWFDDEIRILQIMRGLTEAFPESGDVWTRTLEIKDLKEVTCSGFARSNRAYLGMLEALRKTPGVADLQVIQVRGENPLQFSLSYRWSMGVGDGH